MHASALSRHLHLKSALAPALAVAGLLFAGCQNYTQQSAGFSQAWRSGQLQAAVDAVSKKATDTNGGKDGVVWNLELGSTLRATALAAGQTPPPPTAATPMGGAAGQAAPAPKPEADAAKRSIDAFETAFGQIQAYDEKSKVSVTSEAAALMTNLANLPYRGYGYDRIMLHTYEALDWIELGDFDKARVELNRLQQSQRDVVAQNSKRIEETQKLATENHQVQGQGQTTTVNVSAAEKDPRLQAEVGKVDAQLAARMKGYGPYVNPFSVFLDGLYFTVRPDGASDMERARKSMERVAGMSPDNPYLRADLAAAEGLATGSNVDGTTYVIFETGSAPSRQEFRIDLPTFLVTNRVTYVGAALPRLQFDDNYLPSIDVDAGGKSFRTAQICSMDSVVAQDFRDEFKTILVKTLISTAAKAAISAAVQNQLKDQGAAAQLLGGLITGVASYATTIADTRSWTTLPKEFQYCRFATPADRLVTINAGSSKYVVKLDPGQVNLLYVKNVAPGLPVYISQTVLK